MKSFKLLIVILFLGISYQHYSQTTYPVKGEDYDSKVETDYTGDDYNVYSYSDSFYATDDFFYVCNWQEGFDVVSHFVNYEPPVEDNYTATNETTIVPTITIPGFTLITVSLSLITIEIFVIYTKSRKKKKML